MPTEKLIDISKKNLVVTSNNNNGDANINISCLMRIANATEAMAINFTSMLDELNRLKKWYAERGIRIDRLNKDLQYARANATRYKNQLKKYKVK